jgi:superfamily II DNA or RNA helicase
VSDVRMAEFQQAAVTVICDRLLDRQGSRRFLLADEVGLGKTIVAGGVLEEWQRRRPAHDLVVVYLCSNAEIADQNRTKLTKESGEMISRITQLA